MTHHTFPPSSVGLRGASAPPITTLGRRARRDQDPEPGCGAAPRRPGSAEARPLLTVRQAADHLQISRSLLYQELRSGRLRVVKIGHLTRIRLEELDRYVREQEVDRIA